MPKLGNETVKAELGRASWKLLHTMAARFPEHPTESERDAFKSFIYLFSRLYPCGECAAHFQELLRKHPPQTATRGAASLHLCHLHNLVNERLGKEEFDCSANLEGVYDCGCGEEPVGDAATVGIMEGMSTARDPSFRRRRERVGSSASDQKRRGHGGLLESYKGLFTSMRLLSFISHMYWSNSTTISAAPNGPEVLDPKERFTLLYLLWASLVHAATAPSSSGYQLTLRSGDTPFISPAGSTVSKALVVSSFSWAGVGQGTLRTLTLTHFPDLNSAVLAAAAVNRQTYSSMEFTVLSTINFKNPSTVFSMRGVKVQSVSWTGDTTSTPVETIVLSFDQVTISRTESNGSSSRTLQGVFDPTTTSPSGPITTSPATA
ncbi:hypothetical protein BCR35DRAFT_352556 [Leucosporidium creatinivorum]|uniref:Sulfhydryl oxidase n=1 Tax=Leucosporidium creatinivorum TaxID=106004 RepID=A0A1Y2F8N4_9BASI|nr:hypothetical protein BCR35DRAFT_352556 [Leucosporidium creatinivorum]